MYRNILIPVEFDENDKLPSAFEAARTLADTDAKMTLIHVVETVPVYVSDYVPVDVIKTTRKFMAKKLNEMARELPGAKTALSDGRPGPEIVLWAEENGIDCIVIGSHKPTFSDILLGSVAHHVVRHANCAVHVVR